MTGVSNKTRLAHVRWLAGGTGAGKSTLCRILAQRHDLTVYIGDRAELTWVPRFTPETHPYAWANISMPLEQRALLRPEQRFADAASLHGETIDFVVEDLLAMPEDRPILVDWFGNTPHDVMPLLARPEHAIFLLPTKEFRRTALTTRFADRDRARLTWGNCDHAKALEIRLARDDLWDAEIRRQAAETGAPTMLVDGSRTADELADELAQRFQLAG